MLRKLYHFFSNFTKKNPLELMPFACLAFFFLPSCEPATVAVGGVLLTNITAYRTENSLQGMVKDNLLASKIRKFLMFEKGDLFARTKVCVKHAHVLIICSMHDDFQVKYLKSLLSNKFPNTHIDYEVTISDQIDLSVSSVQDSCTTSVVKSALIGDFKIHATNYNITTYQGVVYVLGLALTEMEKTRVIKNISKIDSVKRVVMYVDVKGREVNETSYDDIDDDAVVVENKSIADDEKKNEHFVDKFEDDKGSAGNSSGGGAKNSVNDSAKNSANKNDDGNDSNDNVDSKKMNNGTKHNNEGNINNKNSNQNLKHDAMNSKDNKKIINKTANKVTDNDFDNDFDNDLDSELDNNLSKDVKKSNLKKNTNDINDYEEKNDEEKNIDEVDD